MNRIGVVAKFARMSPRGTPFVEVRPLSGLRKKISRAGFNDRTNRIANRQNREA
jgi:hypothetical protein